MQVETKFLQLFRHTRHVGMGSPSARYPERSAAD